MINMYAAYIHVGVSGYTFSYGSNLFIFLFENIIINRQKNNIFLYAWADLYSLRLRIV